MFRAEFVDLLRLPDALEQQFGTQRLGHLAQLAVGLISVPSKMQYGRPSLLSTDSTRSRNWISVSRSEVNAACQSGDAAPAYPMVTVPKRNFPSWRSVTFPGRGASNKILAHSRVAAKSFPHTMKRSSNCSMVMFLLKTGMIVMYI